MLNRIVAWNESRMLIKHPSKFNLDNELAMVLEEVIEAKLGIESEDARPIAVDMISNMKSKHKTPEQLVDDFSDMIVFATGAIRKLGYDPTIALEETLKEIESRTGTIVDGKFVKDKSIEAMSLWYEADYSKAFISKDTGNDNEESTY